MLVSIQVVENSDRFHVSENNVPVYSFLFQKEGEVGISRAYALMNANSQAWKLAVKRSLEKCKIRILPHEIK